LKNKIDTLINGKTNIGLLKTVHKIWNIDSLTFNTGIDYLFTFLFLLFFFGDGLYDEPVPAKSSDEEYDRWALSSFTISYWGM